MEWSVDRPLKEKIDRKYRRRVREEKVQVCDDARQLESKQPIPHLWYVQRPWDSGMYFKVQVIDRRQGVGMLVGKQNPLYKKRNSSSTSVLRCEFYVVRW